MSFDALMGNVSREEMKVVLAGSGEVLNGSGYTQSQGGGGSYNNFANAMAIGYQSVSSFYTGLQSTNTPGSAMYVSQQSYNSSNGWGIVAAAVNQYNYNNNYSIATNNSSSNNLGWVATTNGNIKTTDPTAISRLMGLVDSNIKNNRSPGYGLNDFVQNETTASGRAMNDAMYGAIELNAVTVYSNYRKPQGINYQNGSLYLDMGVMMGSGGVIMGSGGYQVQTVIIANQQSVTDPGAPTVANAQKFFSAHFPNFKAPVGGSIEFVVGIPPPGDTLGADGLFHGKSGGYEGLTVPDATGKNLTVYLSNYAFGTDAHMHETLGHELVHVQNLIDHWDVYKSNDKLFWVNTEAAAYQFTMDSANAFGDKTIFNAAKDEYNLYSPSATQDWGHNINIPLK